MVIARLCRPEAAAGGGSGLVYLLGETDVREGLRIEVDVEVVVCFVLCVAFRTEVVGVSGGAILVSWLVLLLTNEVVGF